MVIERARSTYLTVCVLFLPNTKEIGDHHDREISTKKKLSERRKKNEIKSEWGIERPGHNRCRVVLCFVYKRDVSQKPRVTATQQARTCTLDGWVERAADNRTLESVGYVSAVYVVLNITYIHQPANNAISVGAVHPSVRLMTCQSVGGEGEFTIGVIIFYNRLWLGQTNFHSILQRRRLTRLKPIRFQTQKK